MFFHTLSNINQVRAQKQTVGQVIRIAGLLLGFTIFGTVGIRLIEGSSWLNSLYMIVITATTVGYEDPVTLSDNGKIFIIFYLMFGLGIFTYSVSQLGQWIVRQQMSSMLEQRRMQKSIANLRGHYIVCGIGRMGETISEYLHERGKPFVVIDSNEERLQAVCQPRGWFYVFGDATDDFILKSAGIDYAKALASALPGDADNVYVVLTARMLNPDFQIIARASDDKASEKIKHAGATRVVSPFRSGAVKIARFMIHPAVEDFVEVASKHVGGFQVADLQISESSPYCGKKLSETDFSDKGIMIIGICRLDQEPEMPPPSTTILNAGDSIFALGSSTAVNQLIEEFNEPDVFTETEDSKA
ncbi:potassium channel family protein [Gimesia aquarii]|uniref:Voltage-gated potassium channel Kch n=1 Tax=Gimesia aquarii TaxID=2527964 RepID=A0A517WPT0_9PLAN|nr:potassium channel protein [Gimesia aquarii]QDU07248.1 Voltage-gated potassium channel Kch [Gimesia aquarii]